MDPLASPTTAPPLRDRPIEESPYWAEGPTLVVRRNATLPERCVLCNERAERYVKKRYRWHAPWLYLLIIAGLLIYLIVAALTSRRMKLRVPVCSRHAARHRLGTRLQYLGLASIGVGFLGLFHHQNAPESWPFDPSAYMALLVLGSLIMMIVGSAMSKLIKVKRLTSTHGYFSAGVAFLQSCPDHWWDAEDDTSRVEDASTA